MLYMRIYKLAYNIYIHYQFLFLFRKKIKTTKMSIVKKHQFPKSMKGGLNSFNRKYLSRGCIFSRKTNRVPPWKSFCLFWVKSIKKVSFFFRFDTFYPKQTKWFSRRDFFVLYFKTIHLKNYLLNFSYSVDIWCCWNSCCFKYLRRCSLATRSCCCWSICCCWRPAISLKYEKKNIIK